MRSHEMIYVFSAKGAFYNRVDTDDPNKKAYVEDRNLKTNTYNGGKDYKCKSNSPAGKRCALTVITKPQGPKVGNHPTEKPVELYRWLIERYSPPGGTVLDPTFGSGNSCYTAQALGRHAIGIEKDKGFYDKAMEKITPRNTID